LTTSDIIPNLVDRLIAEKEENFMLRLQQLQQSQQVEKQKQSQD